MTGDSSGATNFEGRKIILIMKNLDAGWRVIVSSTKTGSRPETEDTEQIRKKVSLRSQLQLLRNLSHFAKLDKTFFNSSATAFPTSFVVAFPPMSPVLTPLSIVLLTASSTAFASTGRFNEN